MIDVVPFKPHHLKGLIVNDYVGYIQDELSDEYGLELAKGDAHTIIANDNVIGCAGLLQRGKNRWHGWALLSEKSAPHMLSIVRTTRHFLDNYNCPRIETNVRVDFKQGNKFVKLLGFTNETPKGMKNFGEDGFDYYLYARCK